MKLKFRAWDLDHKWMDDHFFIQSNGIAHDTPIRTFDTPNIEIEENPNLIVMQWTGLQDVNGVDIYCGDILSCYHFTDRLGYHHQHEHIVQWSDKFCGWLALNKESMNEDDGSVQLWVYMKSNKHTAKVISNIHQDGDLK